MYAPVDTSPLGLSLNKCISFQKLQPNKTTLLPNSTSILLNKFSGSKYIYLLATMHCCYMNNTSHFHNYIITENYFKNFSLSRKFLNLTNITVCAHKYQSLGFILSLNKCTSVQKLQPSKTKLLFHRTNILLNIFSGSKYIYLLATKHSCYINNTCHFHNYIITRNYFKNFSLSKKFLNLTMFSLT